MSEKAMNDALVDYINKNLDGDEELLTKAAAGDFDTSKFKKEFHRKALQTDKKADKTIERKIDLLIEKRSKIEDQIFALEALKNA